METWKEIYQYILGALMVLCFFGIIAILIFVQPAGSDVLYTLCGVLGTITVGVANYFFGSSKGSSDKNKMLTNK
jgi:hypothetical protein